MNTSDNPSGIEILFLWRLAVAGGGDWKKDVKPDLGTEPRKRLIRSGLLVEEKRSPDGGGRKILYFSLTDRGWEWLSEHLNAPIETKSPASRDVLVRFLARLQTHLKGLGLSLGEFIQTRVSSGEVMPSDLGRQIESAYYSLSGGRANVRVRLADLRDALTGVSRSDLDSTLLDMATTGRASLYRFDNPLELEPRDQEATLRTPSGEERHIVYLGGREA